MIKSILFEVQSQDWLDFRTKFVTGTEIASLFGMNPYKSANSLALEKHEGLKETFTESTFVTIGRTFEDSIINYVGGQTAGELGKVEMYYDEELGISCTLDGLIDGLPLECKCMYYKKFVKSLERNMPPYYILQLLIQMYMLGKTEGYFGVLLYTPENFKTGSEFSLHFDAFPLIIEEINLYKVEVSEFPKLMEYIKEALINFHKKKSKYVSSRPLSKKVKEFLENNVEIKNVGKQ